MVHDGNQLTLQGGPHFNGVGVGMEVDVPRTPSSTRCLSPSFRFFFLLFLLFPPLLSPSPVLEGERAREVMDDGFRAGRKTSRVLEILERRHDTRARTKYLFAALGNSIPTNLLPPDRRPFHRPYSPRLGAQSNPPTYRRGNDAPSSAQRSSKFPTPSHTRTANRRLHQAGASA